jgi:hypothetical protein
VVAILGAATAVTARATANDALPFTDANAHGYLGFCNTKGQQIT